MANVGKSSTFNLLSDLSVPSENYPFCTIEPNNAMVKIKDERFDKLIEIYTPESQIPAVIQITDIAGLVKGASEGAGLGNEFLSNIQQVDAIYHVVRAFTNSKILHTEGEMDVIRDIHIINNELIQKDIQFLDKKLLDVTKKYNRNPRDIFVKAQYECL